MNDNRPEWDNQPALCIACMAERDDNGKCKCPSSPSIQEMLAKMGDDTENTQEKN